MNKRDALRRKCRKTNSETDWERYKKQRNKVSNDVRKAQRNHHKTLLKNTENEPNKFWRALKDIFPTKEKNGCAQPL